MDERHTQIREGAGLEESKLNVEFIAFLQKWSTPMLLVVALVALGFVAYQRLEKARIDKVNRAFDELNGALNNPNPKPELVAAVANDYEGVRGVPALARLAAADRYLELVRKGIKAGATIGQDGTVTKDDLMTEEDRTKALGEAERLYQQVLDKNSGNNAKALHAFGAAYGLAAVAECRGDLETAKKFYEKAGELAKYAGFDEQESLAKKRIEGLASLASVPKLYTKEELPKPPEPPAITPNLPMLDGQPGATGATGGTGATGTPGATGSTGGVFVPSPAPEAATGSTGATGATGSTGTTGTTGSPANPPTAPQNPPPAPSGATGGTGTQPAAPAAPPPK